MEDGIMMDDGFEAMVERSRRELLAKGYTPNQVNHAIVWATNSAEGMAGYFGVAPADLLPGYPKDAESWIRGVMGER